MAQDERNQIDSWSGWRQDIKYLSSIEKYRVPVAASSGLINMSKECHDVLCKKCRVNVAEVVAKRARARRRQGWRLGIALVMLVLAVSCVWLLLPARTDQINDESKPTNAETYPITLEPILVNELRWPPEPLTLTNSSADDLRLLCKYKCDAFEVRTFLVLNVTANTNNVQITSIKVYDSTQKIIGIFTTEMLWKIDVYSTQSSFSKDSSTMMFVYLDRPLGYDEQVTIVAYYQNRILGSWTGIIH